MDVTHFLSEGSNEGLSILFRLFHDIFSYLKGLNLGIRLSDAQRIVLLIGNRTFQAHRVPLICFRYQ